MVGDMYRFRYSNGVVQDKVLVSHSDWLLVKGITDEDEYKVALRSLSGGREWFTDQSPLYAAIDGSVLVLGQYSYPCAVEK